MYREKPIHRISAFLPPCEDIAVGHPLLVRACDSLAGWCHRNDPQLWPTWRRELLQQQKQEDSFGSLGLWCFLIYRGKLPRAGQIAYPLREFLIDGFLPQNRDTDAKRAASVVSRLIDEGGSSTAFLDIPPVYCRINVVRVITLYAGPKPENYNPCRPSDCDERLIYPPAVKKALSESELPIEHLPSLPMEVA